MKLYIPTSSLNFNNIMSCESISPIVFYKKRSFGYKSLTSVELNNLDNSILLYEDFPDFERPKSDLVDYPMVIEVDLEIESEGFKKLKEGVWQYDKTIYLNPFSSKIYFLSDKDKKIIISRSESSEETKLVNLYKNNIGVYSGEKVTYNLNGVSDLSNLNILEIENDRKKNRIKGFAYSYIIAANNSISKDTANLKSIVNQIIDISSAIVNSVSAKSSIKQRKELKMLLYELDAPDYSDVLAYLKSICPEKYEVVWNKLHNQFELKKEGRNVFSSYFNSLVEIDRYEKSLDRLKKWVEELELKDKAERSKFNWDNIAIRGTKLTQFEDPFTSNVKTKEMYQNLINDVFTTTDITHSTFSSEKSQLADEVTLTLKRYYGEEWDKVDAKNYLNNLRRNLAGQESFDIKWNFGLISAIASLILKGEDFYKLQDFMTANKIEDKRLAFGLFGCINGFANLSRIITSDFYELDKNYLTEIYKKIYKQLHNIELYGELPKEVLEVKHKEIKNLKNNAIKKLAYTKYDDKEIKSTSIAEDNNKVPKQYKVTQVPKCPKCNADMVKRSPSNHDSFYGCSNFRTSSCDGKRDLDFNELNNKYEIVKKEGDDFLRYSDKDRILRYVEKNNGQCRISELNKYLKDMNFNSVNMTRAFVESNLNHELIVDKDKHGGAIVKKK